MQGAEQNISRPTMLQAILESAVTAILAIDRHGHIHSVNPATERMFGYSSEEMLGKPVNMLMPEPYRSQHDGYISRHLATGEKRIIGIGREVEGQRKDGSVFPIHLSVGKFEVKGETFFSGIINDLSARARLQAEIDRQSLLLQTVFDNVPEALVITAADGQIILFNPAAELMFGYSPIEALGLDWSALFDSQSDFEQLEGHLAASARRGEASISVSISMRSSAGIKLPVKGHITAIYGANRRQTAIVGLFRDVSEELKQKEAAEKSQRLEAIGQLTGGIAHDFNNILTIISGNLELLDESVTSRQDRELLTRASRAADSGARLTSRLLAFARRRQLAPQLTNLNEQVRSMTELLRRTLGDTIDLKTHFAPELWLARVDAGEVEAAVLNLAINARDAMPEGGKLSIRTDNMVLEEGEIGFEGPLQPGEYVRISVSDNGAGMTKEILNRVFEPFFTTKPVGRGTGLGLSTIYGFVKQSNGHITIYSEPGVGTTVNLYLPRCRPEGAATGLAGSAKNEVPSKGERILVVEDNSDVRELTVKRLERLGYRVVECVTGLEAQRALGEGLDVDLVFSDVMMPGGMTGTDLGRWMEFNCPGLPLVLTTGFADEAADKAAVEKKWPILRKPYTQNDLAAMLRSVLDKGVHA